MSRREPVMVCASALWAGSSGAGLVDGFRRQGWLVQEVDSRNFTGQPGNNAIGKAIFKAHNKLAIAAYRRRIIDECRALRPDIFVTVKGADLDPSVLSELADLGIVTVLFYPDVDFDHAKFDKLTIPMYDHFVTTKSFQLEWLKAKRGASKGTHFVPHGYSESVHKPIYSQLDASDYLADVGYAGNHSMAKAELLGFLLDLRPNTDLRVTGSNWTNLKGRPEILRRFDGVERLGLAFAEFLQCSRINLAFHHGKGANGWEDVVSTRTFEIPACGGFMLHVDNPEIREYFRVGEEIDVFSSVEEMADKIDFYLKHESVRERVCAAGYARAVPAYSYTQRAREILNVIGYSSKTGSLSQLD